MSEDTTPAVALLFEDAEQSAHLREALRDLGAHIVHEGPATQVDRETLAASGAQVVVINLDAAVEEHLDRVYDAVDTQRQRVVFNDAAASRDLSGWDQARWARHLAAKLMDQFDIDPPRPADARPVEVPAAPLDAARVDTDLDTQASMAFPDVGDEAADAVDDVPQREAEAPAEASAEDAPVADLDSAESEGDALSDDFAALLAEGRDLLAAAEDPDDDADDFARITRDDDVLAFDVGEPEGSSEADGGAPGQDQALHVVDVPDMAMVDAIEADFDWSSEAPDDASREPSAGATRDDATPAPPEPAPASIGHDAPAIDWEAVEAVSQDIGTGGAMDDGPQQKAAPTVPDWGLVDFGADGDAVGGADVVSAGGSDEDAGGFGVEKMSAAEFLSPGEGGGESPIEPGLSLELVSLEEAVRPQMSEHTPAHEMSLDAGTGLRRVVAIGATADAAGAVRDFLAALPARPAAAMLLFQHVGQGLPDDYLQQLGAAAEVRVRMAEHDSMARNGEVLVMPPGQGLQLDRSGRIRLAPAASEHDGCDPSIDAGLAATAMQFGADTVAVLLVSDAGDALAGAQVVHGRGGRVWLHQLGGDGDSSLATMLRRESLLDAEDTPQALARRLLDITGIL